MPTTAASAETLEPSASSTPTPGPVESLNPVIFTPVRRSTPPSTSRRPAIAPTSGPSARARTTGRPSSTVTATPSCWAALATSAPMKPPPTTSSDSICVRVARRARASSSVRSVWTEAGCPGSVRATRPVAITTASPCNVAPSESSSSWPEVAAGLQPVPPPPGRSATAAIPRWTRTPRSSSSSSPASAVRSGSQSPVRICLDSGGRSYGACCSAPTRLIRPWYPAERSCSTVRRPPRPAPMIITCSGWPVMSLPPQERAEGQLTRVSGSSRERSRSRVWASRRETCICEIPTRSAI